MRFVRGFIWALSLVLVLVGTAFICGGFNVERVP